MNLKIFAKSIDEESLNQVHLLLEQQPFKNCKVRIMPDTHAGKGCVIGFTADLGDKVIPNIVGVDIGCGMHTVNLGDVDLDLQKLDNVIREYIPSGKNVHETKILEFPELNNLCCFKELKRTTRIKQSLGTLGGGNHFIEVDKDDHNNKYLIIHTGSRNLGKQVAEYYQELAYELLKGRDEMLQERIRIINNYKVEGRSNEIQKALVTLQKEFENRQITTPKALCYLQGKYRDMYLHDMKICQEFAVLNRETIANIILKEINLTAISRFETIHNYIDMDTNIV